MTARYARQIQVRGFGRAGQQALEGARVRVWGRGPDAEICARYLVGAGVGTIVVDPGFVEALEALNTTVAVHGASAAQAGRDEASQFELTVELGGEHFRPGEGNEVARGSSAARWVIARLLGATS